MRIPEKMQVALIGAAGVLFVLAWIVAISYLMMQPDIHRHIEAPFKGVPAPSNLIPYPGPAFIVVGDAN